MNVYDIFVSGGPVMWPLLACSFIALTVVIERSILLDSAGKKTETAN